MAEFTLQQKAILGSTARHNLINTASKTGKTTVLIRRYLNCQERPATPPRALFITVNALATRQVQDSVQRITALDWSEALIGTVAEIGCKLVQRFHRHLGYSKPPRIVPDTAATADRDAAQLKALQIQSDLQNPAFREQWDQEYVQRLRHKNLLTTRSAVVEAHNLFVRRPQPELQEIKLVVADNIHDLTTEELLVLAALQQRVNQSFLAGNSNLAIFDRYQQLDPENWLMLIGQGFKTFPLTQCFGMGPALGLFVHQLAAHNSKRIYENHLAFSGDTQEVVQVQVAGHSRMLETILEMDTQLQLGIQNRLLAVVMRNPEDALEMARRLHRPAFLQTDKHDLWMRTEPPRRGIVCTTSYETAYLRPDYVALPNCLSNYWPYPRERSLENARRAFLRSISHARCGVFFFVPEETSAVLRHSLFVSEGNTPKTVIKTTPLAAMT